MALHQPEKRFWLDGSRWLDGSAAGPLLLLLLLPPRWTDVAFSSARSKMTRECEVWLLICRQNRRTEQKGRGLKRIRAKNVYVLETTPLLRRLPYPNLFKHQNLAHANHYGTSTREGHFRTARRKPQQPLEQRGAETSRGTASSRRGIRSRTGRKPATGGISFSAPRRKASSNSRKKNHQQKEEIKIRSLAGGRHAG